jgi:NitT/TauT family transport system substrate-binding protein
MRLIHKLACGLAAVVPVLALAGCSGGGTASGAPETPNITIDVVPTADAAGLYIAYDQGFFRQQGINLTIAPSNGGEFGMGDLQTGKAQLVEGNYVSFILAQMAGKFAAPDPKNPAKTLPAKPLDMRMIADTSQMQPGNQALYVLPNSPYKTVADLVKDHASIGINSPNNIGQVFLSSLFAANGLKSSKQPTIVPVLPKMPEALFKHVVDAAWLPEPFGTEAEQKYGAVQLADFDQGSLQNFPIGTIVGNTSWVKSNPNTIAAFLRAFNQGQQIADTNRAAVEQTLEAHTGVANKVAATMTLDTYPLVIDVPVMQRVPDAMLQFGIIRKHFAIASMIQPAPAGS